MVYWEHFEHDADIGVRGVGESIAQAFEQAALAMMALVVTDLAIIDPNQEIGIECEEVDPELAPGHDAARTHRDHPLSIDPSFLCCRFYHGELATHIISCHGQIASRTDLGDNIQIW